MYIEKASGFYLVWQTCLVCECDFLMLCTHNCGFFSLVNSALKTYKDSTITGSLILPYLVSLHNHLQLPATNEETPPPLWASLSHHQQVFFLLPNKVEKNIERKLSMSFICRSNFAHKPFLRSIFKREISQTSSASQRRFVSQYKMSEAQQFPPQKLRAIVAEVASLLKEKKETVSVAETVCSPLEFGVLWSHAIRSSCLIYQVPHSSEPRCSKFADNTKAAGGLISASLLSTPGASGFYKGGLTVCFILLLKILHLNIYCAPCSYTLCNHA